MAKKVVQKKPTKEDRVDQAWSGAGRDVRKGVMFREIVEKHRQTTKLDNMWIIDGDAKMHVGLPFPALSLEYLFDLRVLPLSSITQIVGLEGSCKSSFLFEMCSWFRRFGGGGVIMENENKLSIPLCHSLVKHDPSAIIVKRTNSIEDWQEGILYWIDEIKRRCEGTKSEPGPGRIMPINLAVDSVVGKLARESTDKLIAAKHAERGHPLEAQLITRFIRTVAGFMDNWPFHLVVVNQLKKQPTQQGVMQRIKGGGSALNFQASLEVEMVRERKIRGVRKRGVALSMTTKKNSYGEDERTINVDMLWWKSNDEWVDESGVERSEKRQHTQFDWWASTIDLFKRLAADSQIEKRRLGAIIDLNDKEMAYKQRGIWSKRLGHRGPQDTVDWTTAGKLIHKDRDLVIQLRDYLNIGPGYLFEPGVDYASQVAEAHDEVIAAEKSAIKRALDREEAVIGDRKLLNKKVNKTRKAFKKLELEKDG